jgi:hypothetical protein
MDRYTFAGRKTDFSPAIPLWKLHEPWEVTRNSDQILAMSGIFVLDLT